ncbi:glycosyl hydrolase family 28 protein [Mucilaginibacter sabulilitoris]|uniref:Glycosyl hydrolase family 28 protein n=1 Tax=Mucilaginibacter sabulilitoris TaxID=1173583 RepID=A0ABZ0TJZ3_9SPHI|nr:glycosyl hydrolase family 28 protein [Mucilaginibacter sabulilitoris]WPU91510.1 glycosyl hydrolase family 28 protein [Mucilaginibacter sabulilitoris]
MKLLRYSFFLLFIAAYTVNAQTRLHWVQKVGAKQYPSKTTVWYVNDNGATNDGNTLNTIAIQKTIDQCSAKGGGIVSFKPGRYLTGSIFLKKNVCLSIDQGVELLGSQNIKDYPEIDTRVAGIEMKWPAALINIDRQTNVAITGKGLVNAQGKPFWDIYRKMRSEYDPKGLRWIVDYDAKRPRTLLVSNSVDVTIKNITLQQAGFWTVQLLYSKQVTVDGITIRNNVDGHGPSTDGIDIDSSSWILVQNCDIDCNDDDFCLKAGRDWDGLRVNKPTEYIVIRKCISRAGAGLLTCGSETSGGIRHVLATDLTGNGTSNGLNIKSAITRGGTVEDIHFTNITMNGVGTAFQITMNWNPSYSYSKLPDGYNEATLPDHWKKILHKVEPVEKGIPHFKDVYISNIKVTGAKKAINAIGLKESTLQNFHFNQVNIEAVTAGDVQFAQGWKWKNSQITSQDNTKLNLNEAGVGQ